MSLNVGNEYIDYSSKCIVNYLKLILEKNYDNKLAMALVKEYINIRYYNYYEMISKNAEVNINHYLKKKAIELKDEENNEKINIIYRCFKYILYLDSVKQMNIKPLVNTINLYRIEELKIDDSNFENNFTKILSNDLKNKEKYLTSFSCEDYPVNYVKTNIRNVYNVNMDYHLKFPKLYSNYAINNTFNSKNIVEDKLFVLYYIVAENILEKIINCDYFNYYLVTFNTKLLQKKEKTNRLLNIVDDDAIKEMLVFKISFSDYNQFKDIIKEYIRNGFKFAIILDDEYQSKNFSMEKFKIFKYIILSSKNSNLQEFKKMKNIIIDEVL